MRLILIVPAILISMTVTVSAKPTQNQSDLTDAAAYSKRAEGWFEKREYKKAIADFTEALRNQ